MVTEFGRRVFEPGSGDERLDALRRVLSSEVARLACLSWELGEASRKAAWHFRAEDPGEEQTAWHRALLRFAGSLRATWT